MYIYEHKTFEVLQITDFTSFVDLVENQCKYYCVVRIYIR